MTFEEYQKQSRITAMYPELGNNVVYPALGLAGEAGEVAEVIKKLIRDDGGVFTDERKDLLKKELGDVMWYVAQMCTEMGFTLEDVAKLNIDKLMSRKERGVVGGSGDNR